jgi:hypothetical protein
MINFALLIIVLSNASKENRHCKTQYLPKIHTITVFQFISEGSLQIPKETATREKRYPKVFP